MTRVLVVAHDAGGANILAASAPALRDAGCHLTWAASGPAMGIWQAVGERPVAVDDAAIEAMIARTSPDLLLTGTSSIADLERHAWATGQRHKLGSLAVVDAWMNYRRRAMSEASGELILPDAFAVADEAMRLGVIAEDVRPSRIHVIGQPHLEALQARLAARRRSRTVNIRPLLVFVSEHIFEERESADCPGYDQFTVADLLFQALHPDVAVDLTILPHPAEGFKRWRAFLATRKSDQNHVFALGGLDRDTALARADGVIGMTSMVLLEASLIGVPTLSLQPGRVVNSNPMIEVFPGIDIATSAADVAGALERLLAAGDGNREMRQSDLTRGAARRLAKAVLEEAHYFATRPS